LIRFLLRSCVVFWSLRFAEPIVLADGVKLATLRDAIAHLGKAIPKSDHDMPAVLTAAELLTNAADHRGPSSLRGSAPCRRLTVTFGACSIPIAKRQWGRRKPARDR
jgi:hypothetical protein